jgi:CRISPR-associated endonuclease Csn1
MSKKILGLDLGSNSLGWALLVSDAEGQPELIEAAGVRIFNKAVEEKTPTPKNQKRRMARLARRTIQRRARRKRRLEHYLMQLRLLPSDLANGDSREGRLNALGNPYLLRAKALDHPLRPHEVGRVLLHLVQRRGFLSNKKTAIGTDMLDDPDVQAVLMPEDEDSVGVDADETAFKADISRLRKSIQEAGCRTLGEYLASLPTHECKRNRDGQLLRTDRQMYREELDLIFAMQGVHHAVLTDDVQTEIKHIIFHQRPIKLKADRVGRCSLEPGKKRAAVARLEYQEFRYLQDINNLKFRDPYTDKWVALTDQDRQKLIELFEAQESATFPKIRKALGLDKKTEINLDSGVKKLRGNTTASDIRAVYPQWDELDYENQKMLVEDLLSIQKPATLKRRLVNYWDMTTEQAVLTCMVELEPDYGNVSLKAIGKLLPYLRDGLIYSEARQAAGYGYESDPTEPLAKLGPPPELPNPIVNKGLHELRRVINAVIAEFGKPDVVRIEMARDLEMNTRRYKEFIRRQKDNTKANDKAVEVFHDEARKNPSLNLSRYPSRDQKIRYRLWEEQDYRCAYSGKAINRATLFSAEVEVDHIIPYSQSLDDSYMNKVLCFAKDNRFKGQRTPIDAFGGNEERWNTITKSIAHWPRALRSKRDRFYKTAGELDGDFVNNQLTDTRYISKEAGEYLKTLGCDVTFTRGIMTSWLRNQWSLNDLIGETDKKERTDHRHHAIDAVVTACIDRSFYTTLANLAKELDRTQPTLSMNDLYCDPPIEDIKAQIERKLEGLIVSHAPQRKISGALHEETGIGYVEGVGAVTRKRLGPDFKPSNVKAIVDEAVRERVRDHLALHADDPKQAFAEGFKLYHHDGKTLIKRVRIIQSKTTLDALNRRKFGVKDRAGEVFKWHAYGNTHHVEIFQHRTKPKKIDARFITAMEAAKRVSRKEPVVRVAHDAEWEFLMALHINDLVRCCRAGDWGIYRVQQLEMDGGKLTVRVHTAATLKNGEEALRKSISTLVFTNKMQVLRVNAIGKVLNNDQAHD